MYRHRSLGSGITVNQIYVLVAFAAACVIATVVSWQLVNRPVQAAPITSAQLEWQRDYRDNPAFHCPRNASLTYHDLKRYVPCPNGATYALVSVGTSSWTILPLETTNSMALTFKTVMGKDANGLPDGTYQLVPKLRPGLTPFWAYVRQRDNPWSPVRDLAALRLQTGQSYYVVLTWVDPQSQNHEAAKVPFDWAKVPNHP
jgi:hypothetical protein